MALTAKRKQELAVMDLPSDEEMQKRIRVFLQRSGMVPVEFAEQIGYANSSLGLFLHGQYDSNHPSSANTRAIRAAAKEFLDMYEVAEPVQTQKPVHRTASFEDVCASALKALQQGSAYLVDGPPGTEKTFSLRHIVRQINESKEGRAVYVYARVDHSPWCFLREVCAAAGIPARGQIDQLIRKLRFFLGGGRTLLVVDEAQHLCHRGLEILRQLLDLPPFFGVLLAGSHDLTQRLSHWQMEQWRSRLRKTLYLNGPSVAECRAIIRAELGPHTDAECDDLISGCHATASRSQTNADGKLVARKFQYLSARDLFFTIETIQQQMHAAETPRKESAA